jgi:ATP-dependent DNA helicase RecG
VRTARVAGFRRRNLGLFEASFTDASRAVLRAKWFHGEYLAKTLEPGRRLALFGKVEFDNYTGELAMLHPEFELLTDDDEDADAVLHVGHVVPVYEAIAKVNTRALRTIMHRALSQIAPLEDPLPESIRRQLKLLDRWTAVREAQFRLIFEEFFWLECGLLARRGKARQQIGIAFDLNDRVRERIKSMLPFKPTGAQKRVLGEIARDMAAPRPMHRLLQGDVGSGKTIVAAEAAVIAIENGYQVAMLAPTEILAAQHFLYLKPLLAKLDYVTVLLTGSFSDREKSQLKKLLAEGLVHVAVGTHALLEKDVEFRKLGLAVIDEQHRFGVMQRLGLAHKGVHPDVLVMTATPIPRTLALTLYGDLDVSVIDELPPGRKPIVTKHVTADHIERIYSFLKKQIDEGRQAYVVYPVIEESETKAMKAAEKMHGHLSREVFPGLAVGLLHGRLPAPEKEAAMEDFKAGRIHILVSTTVIEVGVDVPNATVMLIEQAERFGLAQLHQLRGRVGRGAEQSYCILVTERMNDAARERIRTMVDTSDGFQIAEMDLKLRGPGEFFGTRQSGLPSLRVANILRDQEILEKARTAAQDFVEHPPSSAELDRAMAYVHGHWERRYGLVEVG